MKVSTPIGLSVMFLGFGVGGIEAAPVHVGDAHRVVIDRGVAGVKLGDSEKSVQRLLGTPSKTHKHCQGFAQDIPNCVSWTYSNTKRVLDFGHKRLKYIAFGSAKDLTESAIGLNASRVTVVHSFPKCPTGVNYCVLKGKGTSNFSKPKKPMTLVFFSSLKKSAHVNRFILEIYYP